MSRANNTYRAARRNLVIRDMKQVWRSAGVLLDPMRYEPAYYGVNGWIDERGKSIKTHKIMSR